MGTAVGSSGSCSRGSTSWAFHCGYRRRLPGLSSIAADSAAAAVDAASAAATAASAALEVLRRALPPLLLLAMWRRGLQLLWRARVEVMGVPPAGRGRPEEPATSPAAAVAAALLERACCSRSRSSSARQALQRSCRPSRLALHAW